MNRRWSALINRKLYFDVETDTESDAPFVDLQMQEESLANVIVDNSLEFMAAGLEVDFLENIHSL